MCQHFCSNFPAAGEVMVDGAVQIIQISASVTGSQQLFAELCILLQQYNFCVSCSMFCSGNGCCNAGCAAAENQYAFHRVLHLSGIL